MPPFYVFLPLLGYSTWLGTFYMFLEIFLLCGCLIAGKRLELKPKSLKILLGSLLINQIKLIVLNMTDYEAAHQIKTYSNRGTVFNLRLIFGPNLFLLPLILIWDWFYREYFG